jgi:inosine/xanthosine triphosphatase
MLVFVGSTNPVKLNAVKIALADKYPDIQVIGQEVESGIAEQPMSDEETKTGAINRAQNVWQFGLAKYPNEEILGIGLEGGVTEISGQLWSTVWVAVIDKNQHFYLSNGARFPVPRIIAEPIRQGGEMGPVVNQIVGGHNIRQKEGMIGVITKNFVNRTEEYSGIAKMALGLWYGRDWEQGLV